MAELVADPHRPGGWTLIVNNVAQSYVDLRNPLRLEMMYVRMVASVFDAAAEPGKPLRVLHLGGGGLTLPRYVSATRPQSQQLVVDRDRRLLEFVYFGLPLPDGSGVAVQYDDARDAVDTGADDSFDVIINDVYRGAVMPERIAGTGFAAEVARLLAPGGLYLANVLDAAGLVLTKRQLATIRTAFTDTCVLSTPAMWKGRRDGNTVIVAAGEFGTIPLEGIATAAQPRLSLSIRHGEDLVRFLSGTAPTRD